MFEPTPFKTQIENGAIQESQTLVKKGTYDNRIKGKSSLLSLTFRVRRTEVRFAGTDFYGDL